MNILHNKNTLKNYLMIYMNSITKMIHFQLKKFYYYLNIKIQNNILNNF